MKAPYSQGTTPAPLYSVCEVSDRQAEVVA